MSSTQKPKRPYDLFYSYADGDIPLLKKLEDHLSVLRHEGDIRELHKRDISPGTEWQVELDKFMKQASIILLLISPNFLASAYLYNKELKQTIKRCEEHRAIIVPIILSPCDWKEVPFGKKMLNEYEIVPRSEKAVTSYHKRNEAFAEIAQAVRQAVTNLREYEQEISMGIVNPKPKSIYPQPNTVIAQHPPLIEYSPPNPLHFTGQNTARSSGPRSTNKVSSSDSTCRTITGTRRAPTQSQNPAKGARANTQLNAQSAGIGVTGPSWRKKSSPKLQHFSRTMQDVFRCDDIGAYGRGFRAILLLFFLAFDVGGLTLVSRDWQISQEQPMVAFILSLSLLTLGVLNIYGPVALMLAAIFGTAWVVVGFHYLPLHPITIPAVVIAIGFVLTVARFMLFQNSKKRWFRLL